MTALLLAANLFCLLAFYSVLKIVREALILSESGAEVKSYAAAGQALLLLGFVPLYGAFASRVNRIRLIVGVTLFFALAPGGLLSCSAAPACAIGIAVLPLDRHLQPGRRGAVLGVRQRRLQHERGKRLFPLVGVGARSAPGVGAEARRRSLFAGIGAYRLMLIVGRRAGRAGAR